MLSAERRGGLPRLPIGIREKGVNPDPRRFIPLSPLDLYVMTVLVDGPLHGKGIIKAVREKTEGLVNISSATLYQKRGVLRRQVDCGLLTRVDGWSMGKEGRYGDVTYYALTDFGKEVLKAEGERLVRIQESIGHLT